MRFRYLAAGLMALGLAGCVNDGESATRYGWGKPNSTALDWQKDSDECQRAASVRSPRTSTDAVGFRADIRRDYADCLTARGWTYEKYVGPDPNEVIVECKLPTAPQVERMKAGDCRSRYGRDLGPASGVQQPKGFRQQ
jgi:hypothetical protein